MKTTKWVVVLIPFTNTALKPYCCIIAIIRKQVAYGVNQALTRAFFTAGARNSTAGKAKPSKATCAEQLYSSLYVICTLQESNQCKFIRNSFGFILGLLVLLELIASPAKTEIAFLTQLN